MKNRVSHSLIIRHVGLPRRYPCRRQQRGFEAPAQLHAVNPSNVADGADNSPLQDQMRQDYATGLMGAQRDLLQQNPSGLGRQEEGRGRQLNGYTPR